MADRKRKQKPPPREVVFSDECSNLVFHDAQFTGLEHRLSIFLLLCTHRSIEAFEIFTDGRLGESAVIRSIAALNERLPSPVAEVDKKLIKVTPVGMSVYRQLGRISDELSTLLARLAPR